MTVVWVRGLGGVFVRADAVVVLEVAEDGLWAECVSGRVVRLTAPQVFHDETRRHIRPLEREVLRVIGVADFLSLTTAPAATPWVGQP